jgi:hypothetical protein
MLKVEKLFVLPTCFTLCFAAVKSLELERTVQSSGMRLTQYFLHKILHNFET